MKQIIIVAVIGMLFLVACSQPEITSEQNAFKEKCMANNHMWMKMSETKNGMVTGPACFGCMPDNENHLCNQSEYEAHIK